MSRSLISRFGFFCLLSLALSGARPGGFKVIGPGGGGAMYNPTISPHDANTALVSCDMTGAYITHDGGRAWRMFNLRGTVKFFAFDPLDPKTIYAQTIGLWRSRDGGESWQLLYPQPSSVKAIKMDSDHADEAIVAAADPLGAIVAMAIDPADSKTLLAAAGDRTHAALFISHDAGQNWKREQELTERPLHLWIDPNSPQASRTLYFGGAHSVQVRKGTSLQNQTTPAAFLDISGGFAKDKRAVFYAVAKNGAYVSTDGAASWKRVELPGSGGELRAVATSLRQPATAYLSYNDLTVDGRKWMGVAKTSDYGQSWTLAWKEATTGADNVHDAWITPRFGPAWGENPLTLGVAEQDPELCFATDLGRTMRTTDGGANWTALYSQKKDAGGWMSRGLDVTTSYGYHFDPFDAKRQFITYTDIGLFRSEDGGQSWISSTQGVPERWLNTTYWVEFDPAKRGRMWSVNSGTHDLPRPKMWRRNSVLNYKGGVCRSEDGGKTWIKSNDGMDETAPTHILLDPTSLPDARVLYVAAFGRGVYKSSDGGRHWALKNQGITQEQPFAWRIARAGNGDLYVLVARRSEDATIGGSGDGALYRSTDGAEHWSRIALPNGVNAPNGLAIDGAPPARMYLATWTRPVGTHGEGGGIYMSDNGGQSWRKSLDRDEHIYDVTIDPKNPKRLYAAGFESSAWTSADRGEHWTRIPGFNFKWAHRVIPDPLHPEMIYVTTFGGSVWHGAVAGDARPVDIATPGLEPGR